jgi:hypothetical protein
VRSREVAGSGHIVESRMLVCASMFVHRLLEEGACLCGMLFVCPSRLNRHGMTQSMSQFYWWETQCRLTKPKRLTTNHGAGTVPLPVLLVQLPLSLSLIAAAAAAMACAVGFVLEDFFSALLELLLPRSGMLSAGMPT